MKCPVLKYLALLVFSAWQATNPAYSCDITPPPGSDLGVYVNSLHDGQKMCLGAANYYANQILVLANNVTISGSGIGETVVLGSGSRAFSIRGEGVTMHGFSLVGHNGLQKDRTYGILAYRTDDISIWSVSIDYFKISIGVVESTNVRLQNIWASNNGDPDNESAGGTSGSDPHLWITGSENILVRWGNWEGQADGFKPGGDGELAAYNSNNVRVLDTFVMHSGASGIYFVNCDSCEVSRTRVHAADGWGLDIVAGSENFRAEDNHISASRFGSVIFHEDLNGSGRFAYNLLTSGNNSSGHTTCSGINVRGEPENLELVGNTNTDGPITCVRQ